MVVYDVLPCQGNLLCTQPIPQSVMKLAAAKPDVVIPILTATSLPGYVNEMKRAGIEATLFESSFNALGTDVVQSKVLQVGGPGVASYYKGATLVSATVAGDWRLPGFGPPPIGVMCNDTYAAHTKTGDSFKPDTEGYTKWGMVGLVCTNMRMVARALYDAGNHAHHQVVRRRAAQAAAGPDRRHRGCAGRRLHRQEDHAHDRVRESRLVPVQVPGPTGRHRLPGPGEHQGTQRQTLTVSESWR